MNALPWPIFGDDKRWLQAEFLSLCETNDAVKHLFDTLQGLVRLQCERDEFLPAQEYLYQRILDVLVPLVAQNKDLQCALQEYLREWIDSEVYRTCDCPPMSPYGQRQAYLLPDNPCTLGPDGPIVPWEAREDHRKKIESIFDELHPRQGPGRGKGHTKYFRDVHDFRETMIALIRAALRDGRYPSEEVIAEMLIARRANADIAMLSMKRYIQRYGEDHGFTWEVLKTLAGVPH